MKWVNFTKEIPLNEFSEKYQNFAQIVKKVQKRPVIVCVFETRKSFKIKIQTLQLDIKLRVKNHKFRTKKVTYLL